MWTFLHALSHSSEMEVLTEDDDEQPSLCFIGAVFVNS